MRLALFLACAATLANAELECVGQPTSRPTGRVVAWGSGGTSQAAVPNDLTNVVAIAVGTYNNLALRNDGTLAAWQEFGTSSTWSAPALTNVAAIAAGNSFGLAVLSNGQVVAWGANPGGQTNVPLDLTNAVAVAANGFTAAALRNDGTIVVWGEFARDLNNAFAPFSDIVAIESKDLIALRSNGTVAPGGMSLPDGFNGDLTAVAQSAAKLGLKSDGRIVVSGPWFGEPYPPAGATNLVRIAAGQIHALALKADGTALSWGYNMQGQTNVPAGLSNVVALAGGNEHSLAIVTAAFHPLSAGAPNVYVDGRIVGYGTAYRLGRARLALTTTYGGLVYFTLDGSDPRLSGQPYTRPVDLRRPAVVRAVAFTPDLTRAAECGPFEIEILESLTATSIGGGVVTMDRADGLYPYGSNAVFAGSPQPGWRFLQWLGACSGTNPTSGVSMTEFKCVEAVFGTALNLSAIGAGSVSASPAASAYPFGSEIVITATPQAGSRFLGWGAGASGTNNPVSFRITSANPAVSAIFTDLPAGRQTLTVSPSGRGAVTITPLANDYPTGQNVLVTSIPQSGQRFLGWNGSASGSSNPLVVTLNESKAISAVFSALPRLRVHDCPKFFEPEIYTVQIEGEFGAQYRLEGSTNLIDWTGLGTLTNTFGVVQYSEPGATNLPVRFYRALAP